MHITNANWLCEKKKKGVFYQVNFCVSDTFKNLAEENELIGWVNWIRKKLSEAELFASSNNEEEQDDIVRSWLNLFYQTRLAQEKSFVKFQVIVCCNFFSLPKKSHSQVVSGLHQELVRIFSNSGTTKEELERSFQKAIETR